MEKMRTRIWAFLVMVGVFVTLLLVSSKTAPHTTPVEPEEVLVVGVVLVSGVRDGGWSEAHANGIASLHDVQILYQENVSDRDGSVVAAVDELASKGAKVIFTTSVDYGPQMPECARTHPDIMFYHCTGNMTAANLATYLGRMYQARYLTGIAAGMYTKTNQIGFVAACPIPEVVRGIDAFTLGARRVNPKVEVHVEWSGAWDDAQAEYKAVERLLTYPIDILAQHQNTGNPVAALKQLDRTDVCAVGYNLDRSGGEQDAYLTAAVWNWGAFYRSRIEEFRVGLFVPRCYWDGIETGIVDFVSTPRLSGAMRAEMEKARRCMLNGEWDVFYGPIYDAQGQLRVFPGETLSDEYLLKELDWYVAGVQAPAFTGVRSRS